MSNDEVELLYNKYKNFVYRPALSYCKNTADSEDIMQETFLNYKLLNNSMKSAYNISAGLIPEFIP